MRELKNKLTAGKSTKNTQNRKAKNFGYQILGFGSGGAGGGFIEATGGTITETGDFDYYDNYISDIEIYQYPTTQASTEPGNSVEIPADDPDLKPIYGLRITEAYPKSVGAIELGYATRDTYNKQTIEFAYRKWEEIPADEL